MLKENSKIAYSKNYFIHSLMVFAINLQLLIPPVTHSTKTELKTLVLIMKYFHAADFMRFYISEMCHQNLLLLSSLPSLWTDGMMLRRLSLSHKGGNWAGIQNIHLSSESTKPSNIVVGSVVCSDEIIQQSDNERILCLAISSGNNICHTKQKVLINSIF